MAKSNKRKRGAPLSLRMPESKRPKHLISGSGNLTAGSERPTCKAKIPFGRPDNILLVGEGDFSFSVSLLDGHKCKYLTASSYDDKPTLLSKYPKINTTLGRLGVPPDTVQIAPSTTAADKEPADGEEEWQGISPASSKSRESLEYAEGSAATNHSSATSASVVVLHGIDAKKLSQSKAIRSRGPFDKIVFNFPHVGGVSKDVNRQVRLNQELLVGFFKSCKSLLAMPGKPVPRQDTKSEFYESDEEIDQDTTPYNSISQANGQVIISVFEGEPYTLWNVRDLARHSGYKVIESFRFPWEAYPGYKHARTIGDVQGKEREDGKRGGAWRGEEREARMYVFEVNATPEGQTTRVLKKLGSKKVKADDSEDSY